jgi:Xaa-Pro aminopeptidase
MTLFPEKEIFQRLYTLADHLKDQKLDLAIIHHNADLFYFTGTVQDGYLIVSSKGNLSFAVRRNLSRTMEQTPVRPVVTINGLKDLSQIVEDTHREVPRTIALAMDVLPASAYLFLKEKIFPNSTIVDVSLMIRLQRAIKSDREIELMRDAAKISHAVYSAVPSFLKEGVDEWELCVDLETVARKHGHLGLIRLRNPRLEMYFGHVLSGPEAATPSYGDAPTGGVGISAAFAQGSTKRSIKRGEIVSVDTMICHQGYLNDQTRNFALGYPPDELLRAYEFSLQLHDLFRKMARAGSISGDIYNGILSRVRDTDLAPYFMGTDENRVSFIGHGLGIEVDEFPFIAQNQKMVLVPGMVVAFEPKFVIPGKGIAGLENTYLITEGGAESLNISPEHLFILS